jgi:hypothetical protein
MGKKRGKFDRKLGIRLGLDESELVLFKKLTTPIRIQDYLDTLAINWEKDGSIDMSPRSVIRAGKAHCFEGAMFAALALWLNGEEPLILTVDVVGADGHCIALYKRNGLWGAISKTNHAALRFRDPVYRTVRELVMSYFHECWNDDTGKKNLRGYSGPFNMRRYVPHHHKYLFSQKNKKDEKSRKKTIRRKFWETVWVTDDRNCELLQDDIRYAHSTRLFPDSAIRHFRKPDKMEMVTGTMTEWKKEDPRT